MPPRPSASARITAFENPRSVFLFVAVSADSAFGGLQFVLRDRSAIPLFSALALLVVAWQCVALAEAPAPQPLAATANFGPYNAEFLRGGVGLTRPLAPAATALSADAPWSLGGWVRPDQDASSAVVIAAVGNHDPTACRCLLYGPRGFALRLDDKTLLEAAGPVRRGEWQHVMATFDGDVARLYVEGEERGALRAHTPPGAATFSLAPESANDPSGDHHYAGAVANFRLAAGALAASAVKDEAHDRPLFGLVPMHHVGVGWPWQEKAWRGLLEPQPAWTLPRGTAPPGRTRAALPPPAPVLEPRGVDTWALGRWRLIPAPDTAATPVQLAESGFDDSRWYQAIVPGTALTTLIANGVYPDPDIGLNNLAIPESLNRQDYWYRTEFDVPAALAGRRLALTFKGINYAADAWLNGRPLGRVRGAFIRGRFDVTGLLRPGATNALAVRVSPPPHPGIPHEQSVAAGPGENGGNLAIDGPTFIASEGWDWIPAIRDRNTGIWQDVELHAEGALRLLDTQVVSTLPLPRTDSADLDIRIPVANDGSAPRRGTLSATIGSIRVELAREFPPGVTEVRLTPADYPGLHVSHPRLWWPNGYGQPELYELAVELRSDDGGSDRRSARFGIREITYDLSLFDHRGVLRRVEVDPTLARADGIRAIDVAHEAIKRTANGWAESLTIAGETSRAVREAPFPSLAPYLLIRVNGVAIAARGGSWGTDDSRKRISRDRLEPYFRLHRNAHLNIIRNWLGQNTEDVFYDLADEYGMLVLNDFWASTQDFQVEPQDPALFLANAADVIRRYRNHPSIAVWFGRNEGVPQPIINEGLADLVASLDGTRYYTGSSNAVNLQGSGPYNWQPPEKYFTTLAGGFSVEVGTPSFASLESIRRWIPEADRWPLGDTYAYHDWHFGGNGDTKSFVANMASNLGAATDLVDFERKAQMMNYDAYRAIFEGFQSGLWTRNSGRLLWMTHPAWPSNAWQIYTSDYDAAAAYYAVAHACEPLHVQMNLPGYELAVVNTTREDARHLTLRARVLTLDGAILHERTETVDGLANSVRTLRPLPLPDLLASAGVALVELSLRDPGGRVVSENLYWPTASGANAGRLSALARQPLSVAATATPADGGMDVRIRLKNPGTTVALMTRVTLTDGNGDPVLPAYYSDNYVSLLPQQEKTVIARCPGPAGACTAVSVRGFNVGDAHVPIAH